jgi:hypothetical protein
MEQTKLRQPDAKKLGDRLYSEGDFLQIHVASGINILAGIWLAMPDSTFLADG